MFRYEVGATILVMQYDKPDYEPTEVVILAKAPNAIKVEILSGGWYPLGSIRVLTNDKWYSVGRIKEKEGK